MSELKNAAAERAILGFLLSGRNGKREILAGLRGYRFGSVEHQVLFDCLAELPLDRPEVIRELLPARLVRAGFPDIDFESFLVPNEMSEAEARILFQELMGRAAES